MTLPGRHRCKVSFLLFWCLLAICYSAVFTTIEFSDFPVQGLRGFAVLVLQWSAASLAAAGLIGLILINRVVAAIGVPLLLCASTAIAYFKLTMSASLTPAIVELWAVTGMATSMDLVSFTLILWLVVALAVSVWCVRVRWKYVEARRSWIWIPVAVALLCVAKIPRCESAIFARSPFSLYSSVEGYLSMRKVASEHRDTFVGVRAECDADSIDVIVVIGESLRADHMGINGYHRQTTPRLAMERNLVSLPSVYTLPVFTFTSVPFMLTRATEANQDAAYEEQSFITLFKNAGFSTCWISNQEDSDTYTYFMYEADSLIRNQPSINLYNFKPHFDSELLPHLESVMNRSGESRRLAVVHSIGSHWWYGCHFDESDPDNFTPVAHSKVISDNTLEQMVNSYDNTILATDKFMSQMIDMFSERNAVIFFQADHGESLGEEGRLLHGKEAPELHYPGAFVWYSDKFADNYPEKVENLRRNASKQLTTEYLFHSVLDAAGIDSPEIIRHMSLFR